MSETPDHACAARIEGHHIPKEPPNFDCRDADSVLRLRLRDWCWPAALALVIVIPILGRSTGTYRVGSVTYYANTFGPLIMLTAALFAGLRWCWIGRLRAPDPMRCQQCNYLLDGLRNSLPDGPPDGQHEARPSRRCPECGLNAAKDRPRRRVPIGRILLDIPGLLVALAPVGLFVVLLLAMVGVIDLD